MLRQMVSRVSRPGVLRLLCSDAAKGRIDKLVASDDVVLFMKGTPQAPMCGFSKAVTQILGLHEVPFASVDVLDDEEVRQGVKAYSDWPTIPQLYVKGEFVGGCDILIQLHNDSQLADYFEKRGIRSKFSPPSSTDTPPT